jgi:adenylate cyclase
LPISCDPIPLGYAYRFLGQYEDSIEVHRKALKRSPNNLFAHMWLTAAYSALGREEEARHQAQELLRLDPTFSLEEYAEIRTMKDKAEVERFIADLRKAGLK